MSRTALSEPDGLPKRPEGAQAKHVGARNRSPGRASFLRDEEAIMYLMMWTHVRDYDDWKTGFDLGEPLRTSYECTGHEIFRDADDPGQLTLFLEFSSREKGDAFLADPRLQENMAKAGVDAEPRTTWVTQTQRVDYRSRRAA